MWSKVRILQLNLECEWCMHGSRGLFYRTRADAQVIYYLREMSARACVSACRPCVRLKRKKEPSLNVYTVSEHPNRFFLLSPGLPRAALTPNLGLRGPIIVPTNSHDACLNQIAHQYLSHLKLTNLGMRKRLLHFTWTVRSWVLECMRKRLLHII